MVKNTLVIGASPNPERYAYKAINLLQENNIPVQALGLKEGKIGAVVIDTDLIPYPSVHTVSLYVGPKNQSTYMDYIIALKPQRVIFNPGTENPELYQLLDKAGIAYEEACTLVLLNTQVY